MKYLPLVFFGGEMIKIGDLVNFESFHRKGHLGYGIYVGEEKSIYRGDGNLRFHGTSQIRMLYIDDPYVMQHDLNSELWHRKYNELTLCTEDEKLQVTLWRLEGVKHPKKESNE